MRSLGEKAPAPSDYMLQNLIEKLFGSGKNSTEPFVKSVAVLSAEIVEQPAEPSFPGYDDPEMAVLAREYGELTDGKIIEVSLSDLLRILPRSRRKSDAYNGLKKRLSALGVQLRVAPNVKRKNNEQTRKI